MSEASEKHLGRVVIRVRGIVQRVGFRYWIYKHAKKRSLAGFVKSEPDGSLLIVAEGPKKDLEYLIEVSREGPPSAVVEDIEVRWEDYKGEFQEFKIAF
ncbi:MAG: acylphosphatase [Desulfurococcales archaeon]|nr:acylphosphatase [Desulfurococcales archaeon]